MRLRVPSGYLARRPSKRTLGFMLAACVGSAGLALVARHASNYADKVSPTIGIASSNAAEAVDRAAPVAAEKLVTDAAAATQAAPPLAAAPLERSIRILLDKAAFWDAKGQHGTALEFYGRALAAAPDNVDALAGAAAIELSAGHQESANRYLDRLRAVAPDDPRLANIEGLRERTPEMLATLDEARRLVGAGHLPEALAAYQKVIKPDAVPSDLALEYYPLLVSASPQDSVEAADALSALAAIAEKAPDSDVIQLVYARAAITQEGSRADGIARLRELAKRPAVATEARTAWRAVLLWQGADAQAQQQLEEYLRENPSDPELDAKRAEYRASLPSEGQQAKMRAYEAMRAKQMAVAEREFRAALAFDANDVDALIMMAAIRQQQGKTAEFRKFVDRAVGLAPDRRQELLGIVGMDPEANAKSAAAAAQAVTAQYQDVAALTKKGSYDQAEQRLRKLMQKSPNAGNYIQLGDIQTRAGHLDEAAASLRKALELAPANADATLALAAVLSRQGKAEEAAGLQAQLEEAMARSHNVAGLRALRSARAEQLRSQAAGLRDASAKVAPLRAALDLDPTNAWLRLELARNLRKSGAAGEARKVMAELPDGRAPAAANQPELLQVAFVWSEELGDWPAAAAAADRMPPPQRTPDMVEVQSRVALQNEIAAATRSGDTAGNRSRLMALAAQPDASGTRGTEIGRLLIRAGDTQAAKRAVDLALANTPTPTPQQRLAYATILLEADRGSDARMMAAGIDAKGLTPTQRRSYERLTDDLAGDTAEQLIAQKKLAQAHDLLTQRLSASPDHAKLNLAMVHWQSASGDAEAALALGEVLVRRNPGDLASRHAAIEAAIAAGELRRADPLIEEGLKRFPADPFLRMEAASVARSRSDFAGAIGYLEQARALRARQLASAQ
jgi:tetratricopeptide (TPR) repeat protein